MERGELQLLSRPERILELTRLSWYGGFRASPNTFVYLSLLSALRLASASSASSSFNPHDLKITILGSNDFYSQPRIVCPNPFLMLLLSPANSTFLSGRHELHHLRIPNPFLPLTLHHLCRSQNGSRQFRRDGYVPRRFDLPPPHFPVLPLAFAGNLKTDARINPQFIAIRSFAGPGKSWEWI